MSSNPSKTPWRVEIHAIVPYIADADGNVVLADENAPLDLIVSAVNFYESLPEDVRRLRPETVAKCVEAVCHRQKYTKAQWIVMDAAVAALEEEGTGG